LKDLVEFKFITAPHKIPDEKKVENSFFPDED